MDLLRLWRNSLTKITFAALLSPQAQGQARAQDTAVLFWGKAQPNGAPKGAEHLLAIRGNHPLPGPESLRAGSQLLEFFDSLRRSEIRRLEVYLSGGASSMAWIPPYGMDLLTLRGCLAELYRQPLSIRELNRARSKLCALKAGGAARLLHWLAPQVRAHVHLISDVYPYGPEVVGSGPFYDGKISHRVLMDNPRWLRMLARLCSYGAHACRSRVDRVEVHSLLGTVESFADQISVLLGSALDSSGANQSRGKKSRLLIFGGEPLLKLHPHAPPGGRQVHLAAMLLSRFFAPIAQGRVQIACVSSDGVDGTSGAAGALLDADVARPFAQSRARRRELQRSISRQSTAVALRRAGALIPSHPSGTNVQDAILIEIAASSRV